MGWMIPAAAAGIGAIGGALGGGGQEHIGPGDAVPKWMRGDLRELYNNVFNLQAPEYYGGDLIAGRTPGYEDAISSMYGFNAPGGYGAMAPELFFGAAGAGLPGVGMGMDYLAGMQGAGPRQFEFDQGTFDTTMANLMPTISGQFQSIMRDPYRALTENVMPGIDLGASMSGTSWGTSPVNRTAIAQRGFDDRAADVYANLRTNAVNQAQGAGMTGGAANLASGQGLDAMMLQGYGNFGRMGGDLLGRGFDAGLSALRPGMAAGATDLGYAQSLIDAERAKWDFEQNAPWLEQQNKMQLLPRYGNALGGGLPTRFGTGGESMFANALTGAQTGLGIYGAGKDAGWWGSSAPVTTSALGGYGMGQDGNWSNLLGQNPYDPSNPFGTDFLRRGG